MRRTLGHLMGSNNSVKIEQDGSGKTNILGVPKYTLVGFTHSLGTH